MNPKLKIGDTVRVLIPLESEQSSVPAGDTGTLGWRDGDLWTVRFGGMTTYLVSDYNLKFISRMKENSDAILKGYRN